MADEITTDEIVSDDTYIVDEDANFFMTKNVIVDKYLLLMGGTAYMVYGVLKRMAGEKSCFPSVKKIGALVGVEPRAIQRAMKTLVDLHLVRVTPRYAESGDRKSNLYTLLTPRHIPPVSTDAPCVVLDTTPCVVNDACPASPETPRRRPTPKKTNPEEEPSSPSALGYFLATAKGAIGRYPVLPNQGLAGKQAKTAEASVGQEAFREAVDFFFADPWYRENCGASWSKFHQHLESIRAKLTVTRNANGTQGGNRPAALSGADSNRNTNGSGLPHAPNRRAPAVDFWGNPVSEMGGQTSRPCPGRHCQDGEFYPEDWLMANPEAAAAKLKQILETERQQAAFWEGRYTKKNSPVTVGFDADEGLLGKEGEGASQVNCGATRGIPESMPGTGITLP